MATDKPRITISLEPEQYQVLKRLAGLQKAPMSRIVADLMAEVTPVLARVADSLELAMRAQEGVRANLKRVAEEAEEDLRPLADIVRNQYDMFAEQLQRIVDAGEQAGGEQAADETGTRPARRGAAEAGEGASPRPVITGATRVQRGTGRKGSAGAKGAVQNPVAGAGHSASPRRK